MSAPRPAAAGRPPRGSRKVAKPHFLENAALARVAAFEAALSEAKHRLAAGATAGAVQALRRAHVRSQTHFGPHLKAHRGMLPVGFTSRNSG